jgi:transposase
MQPTQHDDCVPGEVVLAVSLALASASWKIALHDGKRDKPAMRDQSRGSRPGPLTARTCSR